MFIVFWAMLSKRSTCPSEVFAGKCELELFPILSYVWMEQSKQIISTEYV